MPVYVFHTETYYASTAEYKLASRMFKDKALALLWYFLVCVFNDDFLVYISACPPPLALEERKKLYSDTHHKNHPYFEVEKILRERYGEGYQTVIHDLYEELAFLKEDLVSFLYNCFKRDEKLQKFERIEYNWKS